MLAFLESTMLLERLCGVSTYVLLLVATCAALTRCKRCRIKALLIAYALVLSILAFFYIPGESADFTRLITYMHRWSEMSLEEILAYSLSCGSPCYPLYFWLVGQTHVDGLLPAITTLIGYLCLFSCFWNYAQRFECSQKSLTLALAFLMSLGFYLGFVSNIRNTLAFTIILRCFYVEGYHGKNTLFNLPLYFIAALLHPAGLLLVIIRFLYLVIEPGTSLLKRLATVLVVCLLGAFAIRYGSTFLSEMTGKAERYLANGGYSYIWETLLHIIPTMFIAYALITSRGVAFCIHGNQVFRRFLAITIIPIIIAAPLSYAVFTRFSMFIIFAAPFMLIELLDNQAFLGSAKNFKLLLELTVVASLILACTRGNLSGFKYFHIE